MTPPIGSYSPVNSNLCDQNVSSTLDGISQDLQASPMSPMPQQQPPPPPSSQSAAASQSAAQAAAPQPPQSQINDIQMGGEPIGVPIQPNIIDPYRRSGKISPIAFYPKHENFFEIESNRNVIILGPAAENAELYRNSYAMQSHPSSLVNGHHHHDMQINSFAPSAISNGYGMNLKQEPDVNF